MQSTYKCVDLLLSYRTQCCLSFIEVSDLIFYSVCELEAEIKDAF